MACIVLLSIFLASTISFAEVGKRENGAVVESTTHVYSEVNPKAGDFLWELEGKPTPKYIVRSTSYIEQVQKDDNHQ